MLPKRRFSRAEPTFQNAFSKHFSTFCSPKAELAPFREKGLQDPRAAVVPGKEEGRGKEPIRPSTRKGTTVL